MAEPLFCKQAVVGSNPTPGFSINLAQCGKQVYIEKPVFLVNL